MNVIIDAFGLLTNVVSKSASGYSFSVILFAKFDFSVSQLETPTTGKEAHLEPFKPNSDILVESTAHWPLERPGSPFSVGMSIGGVSKRLCVSTNRMFGESRSSSIVEGERLSEIPITYDNAFGGEDYDKNPIGKGFRDHQLPNIEYFDQLVTRPTDRPEPAGFGPIPADWEPRKSMKGTYGSDYAEKYWPGFPPDFDWGYFNSAPRDQQVEGYLRGDEDITLENMHPKHPVYKTRLPGIRIICLRESHDGVATLVTMNLDTLFINAEEETAELTWRGVTEVETPECFEIKTLGILAEPLSEPIKDAAHYQQQLNAIIEERKAQEEAEFAAESPPDEEADEQVESEESQDQKNDDETEAYLADVKKQIAALRKELGLPEEEPIPEGDPPPVSPEAQAKVDEILENIEKEEAERKAEEEAQKWTREKVINALEKRQPLEDADLSGLDLSRCQFAKADFRGANLSQVNFAHSDLSHAIFHGCQMDETQFENAQLVGTELIGSQLNNAKFDGADLREVMMSYADLSEASLDQCDLSDAVCVETTFTNASLRDAKLNDAHLEKTVLDNANLAGADLTRTALTNASAQGANFQNANFQSARLSGSIFTRAKMSTCNFDSVNAVDGDFTEAELENATFRNANVEGIWLSSARVDGANFEGATCIDMQLDATSAVGANFRNANITAIRGSERANLSGANFEAASGKEPIFETCTIDDANFSFANIDGVNFIQASAKRTNFSAVDMKFARFDYAHCEKARFEASNLFEANFSHANLTDAILDRANLYGAEFLEANTTDLSAEKANLKMTKLKAWKPIKKK